VAKHKQKTQTPLPEIKSGVTVEQLEEIALHSHGRQKPAAGPDLMDMLLEQHPDFRLLVEKEITALQEKHGERAGEAVVLEGIKTLLGIDLPEFAAGLRRNLGVESLLLCYLNDFDGYTTAQINKVPGLEVFATGIDLLGYHEGSALPANRYIVADPNHLTKTIPPGSFHIVLAEDAIMLNERLKPTITQMHNVLSPGGVAVFEIEKWWDRRKELKGLKLADSIVAVNNETGKRGSLQEYEKWILEEMRKDNREGYRTALLTHFELRKPR
jgi:SAM-dependent methyltransferase